MFGGFGLTELLVILAIVLLVFGPKRLKNIGSDLGNAIKGFRKAVTDDESAAAPDKDPSVIEGKASESTSETRSKQNSNV
ncbi:MAG: twin-arginine translocase TatA/TatE family subunit [Pseudomonadales bacterium]|nr:twin-arginine translocase TatA/TatE family subunit [Pseudomonadales bacterium]